MMLVNYCNNPEDDLCNEECLLEYEAIFNTTKDAIGILRVTDQPKFQFEKQNKKMELFLRCYPQVGALLLQQHKIFKAVIHEKTRHETAFIFEALDTSYSILVGIVPIIKNSCVIKLILTILSISSQKNNVNNIWNKLTPREKEITIYVSEGQKNDYIAARLGISVGTVKKTLSNVYKKLFINSRIELIKLFTDG